MLEKIIEIIAEQADVKDPSSLNKDTLLVEDLGLDSLDAVEIIMNIEEVFEIEVADEVFTTVKTIGDVLYYFEQQLN